eukprot:GHVT01092415.1.p3 GENE.GHVT01092415.1~~GHVT01092415.1.p3  ORF type:complete len:107 (-),score=18.72 GHVT01092415.1:133-453(-)
MMCARRRLESRENDTRMEKEDEGGKKNPNEVKPNGKTQKRKAKRCRSVPAAGWEAVGNTSRGLSEMRRLPTEVCDGKNGENKKDDKRERKKTKTSFELNENGGKTH